MSLRKRLATVAVCGLMAASAWANPHRLDDSLSHTVPPNVQMQWLPLTPGQSFAGGMEAWLRVNIRIDTRNRVGRSGRVYMVVSGERTLVFAGQISSPTLEDQFQVRLRSNPDWQSNTRRLNFHFELDVD
jgi:hypothetical protein